MHNMNKPQSRLSPCLRLFVEILLKFPPGNEETRADKMPVPKAADLRGALDSEVEGTFLAA